MGIFLYQIIQMDLEINEELQVETSAIFPAYKRQKSYLLAGIMLDDVSNYTMLYQVQAVKKDGNYHKGMAGFAKEQHIVTGSSCSVYRMGCTLLSPKMKYILWKILRFLPCFAEKKKQIIRKKHICA